MRLATAVVVAALIAAGGCGGAGTSSTASTSVNRGTRGGDEPGTKASTTTTIGTVEVPDVVGKDLASARATLAAAGFQRITANDGTQNKRVPADDWIVFRQQPAAGQPMRTSVYMYLELLKKGERFTNPGTRP